MTIRHRLLFACLILGSLLPAGGCLNLNKTYPEKVSYSLETGRPGPPLPGGSQPILRIRRFAIAPHFEGRELVYRTGELRYESDFYHEWFVAPAAVVTQQVQRWLSASGLFQDVVDTSSSLDSGMMLEGYIGALYGDYREKLVPKAVLEIQLRLVTDSPRRTEVAFHQEYRQTISVSDETPEALVKGWNDGLQQILLAFEDDLRRSKHLVTVPR